MESTKLLRLRKVIEISGLSRAAIYAEMAENRFPRPLRIGRRAVAWRADDIERWAKALPIAEPADDF